MNEIRMKYVDWVFGGRTKDGLSSGDLLYLCVYVQISVLFFNSIGW